MLPSNAAAVKINPLYSPLTTTTTAVKARTGLRGEGKAKKLKADKGGEGKEEGEGEREGGINHRPVFYGQRTRIRKTKEKEMVLAILELSRYG